jgi:hypothetical protein
MAKFNSIDSLTSTSYLGDEKEMSRIKQHEYGSYVPAMPPEERSKLKHSIATVGQILPIIIFEDKVLDGWERLGVLRELRREKKYRVQVDEDHDPEIIETGDLAFLVADFRGDHEEALQFVGAMIERKTIAAKQRIGIALKIRRELKDLGKGVMEQYHTAANAVGISARTVERAAGVEDKAIDEVVEAMEEGTLTIGAAEKIAKRPKENQKMVMKELATNNGKHKVSQALNKEQKLLDDHGMLVPKDLRAVFADVPIFTGIEQELGHQLRRMRDIGKGPSKHIITQSVLTNMTSVINVFKSERPAYVCQKCAGEGCQRCRKEGFLRYGSGQKPKWE